MSEPLRSFENATLKIEWANKQIDQLEALCTTFINENSNLPLIKGQTEGGAKVLRHASRSVPHEVTLLAGDVVRNLRGALDYCWTGLDRAARKSTESSVTMPVGANEESLRGTVKNTEVAKAFPKIERAIMDKIRPHAEFANGGNKPICIINRLANWEKHNLLILTVKSIENLNFSVGTNQFNFISVRGGSNLLAKSDGPDVSGKSDSTVQIVFGEHDFVRGEPIFPLIRRLSEATSEAAAAFADGWS